MKGIICKLNKCFKHAIYLVKRKPVYYWRCFKYGLGFKKETHVLVEGFPESKNFGDALNCFLVESLSGKKVIPARYIHSQGVGSYAVIGSIIHWTDAGATVWGSGIISDAEKVPNNLEFLAVRGELTREVVRNSGYHECPAVYGDPAMLMPLLYSPKVEKLHEVGILPHYIDREHPAVLQMQKNEGATLIDIRTGRDVLPLIDRMLECKVIVTSSLHGLILSHVYGIPCVWIGLGELKGGDFKFRDYLSSVDKTGLEMVKIGDVVDFELLMDSVDSQPISWDPRPLLNCCPFISESTKEEMLSKIDELKFTTK